MRFISLLVTFIAIILAVVLGFSMYSDNRALANTEKEIEAYENQAAVFRTEIETLSPSVEAVKIEKNTISDEIAAIKRRIIYKTKPTAFLTFDDGTSYNTLKILDILKENDIKATFFVVGSQIEGGGSSSKLALQRIVEEGHALAIHAYYHEYSRIYASVEAFFEDFYKIRDLLIELTGVSPNIVRLPSGTATAKSFCERYGGSVDVYYDIVSRLYDEGYAVIDWNVETNDYTSATGVDKIVSNAVSGAESRLSREYKAAVVLMHDNGDTVAALQRIINGIKNLGMGFEPLEKGGYVTRQVAAISKP